MRIVVLCVLSACIFGVVIGLGEKMVGKGAWKCSSVQKCEGDEKYLYRFDIKKTKIDRTHDGFNTHLALDEVMDDSFAIKMDICKYVDGGCKDYQKLSDDCMVNFVKKYAENNLIAVLELAGVDPADFPIQPGEYKAEKFVFNYCELPCKAAYGEFRATVVMINADNVEVGCVIVEVEFKEHEEGEEQCPNCED